MARHPSRMGSNGNSDVGHANAHQLIAVFVHRGNEARVGFTHLRGQRAKLEPAQRGENLWIRQSHVWELREGAQGSFTSYRRALREAWEGTRRWLHALAHPAIQVNKEGAQGGDAVDHVEIVGPTRADRRGVVDQWHARAVLVASDEVDALFGGRFNIPRAGGVGMDERAIDPPVLGSCVGREDFRYATQLALTPQNAISLAGERVGLVVRSEREQAARAARSRLR